MTTMPKQSSAYWAERTRVNEANAQKLAGSEMKRQEKLFKAAYKDITKKIDELYIQVVDKGIPASRTQLWQFSKYLELEHSINKTISGVKNKQIDFTTDTLIKVFQQTTETTLKDLSEKGLIDLAGNTFGGKYNFITDDQVKQYINSVWNDKHFSKRYAESGIKISTKIKNDISDMLISGKNPSAIKLGLQQNLNMSYNNADRLVRTEASYFYNTAAHNSYKAAGLDKVEYLPEEDDAQCDECGDNAADPIYDIDNAPAIPVHPNCRCCYAPVVEFDEP
jgi:SPP1 gp7 family putative phage head morphogenesis protein